MLYVIHHEHQDTYDKENDLHGIAWSIPASFLLAFFVHPTLNRSIVFDTVYTAATVLDTFCMLPQLYMMMRQGGKVCDLLSRCSTSRFTRSSAELPKNILRIETLQIYFAQYLMLICIQIL